MSDSHGLLGHVTGAFIDGAPIDWSAVRSRARTPRDRALVENLYALAAIRHAGAAPHAAAGWRARFARAIVVAGGVITVALLAIVAAAIASGQPIGGRRLQLVVALAFTASSMLLGAATFRDPRSLFLLATFTSVASIFARSAVGGLPDAWWRPVEQILAGIRLDVFVPACLWEFALGFPRVVRFTAFDRLARLVVVACWVIGLLAFGANLAAGRLAIDTGLLEYLVRDHSSRAFWRFFSVALAGALAAILARGRRAPAGERRKVTRLALAIGAGLGPFTVLGVLRTAVPAVDAWQRTGQPFWAHGAVLAAIAATPIMSTAAVLVDRPFEIRMLRWRRAWVRRIVARCSRLASRFDSRVARALERLARSRGRRETIVSMSSAVRDLVAAPVVGVLIQHRNKFVDWSNGTMSLDPSGAIAAMLRASPGPIDVSPSSALPSLLPHEDGRWLAAHNVHVIAPLTSGDGRMVAVVAIGAKTDGTPFDRHDRWLIVLLLTAAAGALDAGGALDPPATPGTRAAAADQEAAFECALCGVVAHSRRLPCRCGQAARLAALPVRVAEKFSVERRLGAGGMGVVYLARDAALDRHVALKTLPGLRPHAVRQLREEARAMAALNHASLATLYGLEMWRRTPVLVVEYFSGGTLAQRIASGAWSAGETVALGVRLARALVHMHARAVLHRDLKPSNIAFTAAGAPKLLDFGLATLSEPPGADHWIRPERVAGTARYAPPELFRGAPPSSAGDRWALALVMLEAIDGDNPFARVRGGVIDPSASANLRDRIDRLPHGVPALRAFLDRALAWSPDDRFQTSGDFLNALEDVADALSVRVAD